MENMLSGLERMVEYDLIVVLKYLTKKDKMSLRASSTTLRRRIDELEKIFKVWRIRERVDRNKLRTIDEESIEYILKLMRTSMTHSYFKQPEGIFKTL